MNLHPEIAGFEDIVRVRAYALWESEGRPFGRDAMHWRLCEEETRRALAPTAPAKPKAAPGGKAATTRRKEAKAG